MYRYACTSFLHCLPHPILGTEAILNIHYDIDIHVINSLGTEDDHTRALLYNYRLFCSALFLSKSICCTYRS